MQARRIRTLISLTFSIALFSCGQQNAQRDNVNAENAVNAQAKFDDLAPAEGDFSGAMTMARSKQPFAVKIHLTRTSNMEPAPQAPSETFSRWILTGNMMFPALAAPVSPIDYSDFSELTNPLGDNAAVSFDEGDLNDLNSQLTLSYKIPNSAGSGQLIGQLANGHFSGTWTAGPVGVAGTFELDKSTGAQP